MTNILDKEQRRFKKEFGKKGTDGNIYIVTSDSQKVQDFLLQSNKRVMEEAREEIAVDLSKINQYGFKRGGELYVKAKDLDQAIQSLKNTK